MKHSERWIGGRVAGHILVVGGGDGVMIGLLEREGHRVVAVDPGQAEALPFADGHFDSVLLNDFLAARVSYERPIAEALRVLRPEGRLIASGPYGGGALRSDTGSLDLRELIDGFADCSVNEVAGIDDRVFVEVTHRRGWDRAAAWRQALGIAERRMEAQVEGTRQARTEAELARGELRRANADRGELDRLRATLRRRETELELAEERLDASRRRAEQFRESLVALRGGRAYRLARLLWKLRRPFTRSALAPEPAEEATPEPAGETAPERVEVRPEKPPTRQREPRSSMVVATILDTMSEACFAPECELMPLTLDGWREQLEQGQPDLLLVESAWNGSGGEWEYRIARYPRPDLVGLPSLCELISACRESGIPTAFWNKEDPVHFERFSEAASLFDHVFTTDSRCVERYHRLPGERTVTPLAFAAQPHLHNPAAVVPERSASPCFAGAWYRDRHPDRRDALGSLLDAARPYGLVIYDRRFGEEGDQFGFPSRFAPHILGRLPYERVIDVYKSHSVFLNANSVVDSPTMCSRRVFELAACDTMILSTPAAAHAHLLGQGLVAEARDEAEGIEELELLLGDERERGRRTRAARRAVFAEHTYAERLATIADVAGLDPSGLRRAPFAQPGNGAGEFTWELLVQPGVTLGADVLADLAAAASFADVGAIGVDAGSNGGPPSEHREVEALDPRAVLVRRDLLRERGGLAGSPERIEARLREWSADGVRLYATDADLLEAGTAPGTPVP